MSYSSAISGDPWVQCDRCGRRVRLSQSKKTWDGLRVCIPDWDPKHPQLSIRARVDRQAVYDGRPQSPDRFVETYGFGSFCLISPNGTTYVVTVDDDGALLVIQDILGAPVSYLQFGEWRMTVDDDGALHVNRFPILSRTMASPTGDYFSMWVDWDGAVKITSLDVYTPIAGDGSFVITSPGGTSFRFAVAADGALLPTVVALAKPIYYLDMLGWRFTVDNDGALHVDPVETPYFRTKWRMISADPYIYELVIHNDGAVILDLVGSLTPLDW